MNRLLSLATICVAMSLAFVVEAKNEPQWSMDASWVDSCSCNASCPCIFGSKPTLGHCEGMALMELKKANYDGVKLDGLKVVAVYRSKKWQKLIISDKASKKQKKAK